MIELMVVLLIVSLLTTIAVPVFNGMIDRAHRAAVAGATRDLYLALTRYNADHGIFPVKLDPQTLSPLSDEGYIENPDAIVSKLVNGRLSIYIPLGPDQFWLVTQSKGDPQSYFVASRTTIWNGGGEWTDGVFWYDWTIGDLVGVDEAM